MHRKLLIFIVVFFSTITSIEAQSKLESELKFFSISTYLNKTIDTLLANLPAGYDTTFIINPSSNINKGASLQINYPNNPDYPFAMHIYITDAQHITVDRDFRLYPLAKDAWPLALLKKEKIACIYVYTVNYVTINKGCIY